MNFKNFYRNWSITKNICPWIDFFTSFSGTPSSNCNGLFSSCFCRTNTKQMLASMRKCTRMRYMRIMMYIRKCPLALYTYITLIWTDGSLSNMKSYESFPCIVSIVWSTQDPSCVLFWTHFEQVFGRFWTFLFVSNTTLVFPSVLS